MRGTTVAELTQEQKKLIEKMGIYHEQQGFPPVTGRIMGLLYVSDRPHLSFEEIVETLNISKSATSNALQLLQQMRLIEYTTYPGDRKRYFGALLENWHDEVVNKMESILGFSKLLRQANELRGDKNPEMNEKVLERIEFMEFLSKEVPGLLQRWIKERKA
ncbi:GbsR/MarR family transcriptional regulator [Rufibacter latericius]|uniref:MarR family transcriptional regulator n=1 Tax=Rufibacter latericius TaxID=2487040 RepID=A0A3M9M9N8_9BACT|nr:MarR family transcriptional regulator [Rufibacter latericius]RNI21887.1 MarR family transcriptional regulator [Rufibacter latericius]